MSFSTNIDLIAQLCFALNREWDVRFQQLDVVGTWDDATTGQKDGYRTMVRMFQRGDDEQAVHASFRRDREREGWTYGPLRNRKYKTDPYIAEYQDLNLRLRLKYVLFRATVRAISEAR